MELQFFNKNGSEIDRISLLPDCLLHQIFSSLNTKSVAQTCILSKRWKTLWTKMPVLNFDYYSFPFESKNDNEKSKQTSFKYFIFRVLSKHSTTNIHKLTYTSSNNKDELPLLPELLISYAASYNVQQLFINTYKVTGSYDWNYCFSTCSSLTQLSIVCRFMDNFGVLALPSLKILEIESNWFGRDKFPNYKGITMFSGCPNLVSLILIDYFFENATISAPKLENFRQSANSGFQLTFPEVELLTPTLKTVTFDNVLPIVKSDSEFSCIREVIIKLKDSSLESNNSLHAKIIELLRVFRNAKSFTMPLKATQVIKSDSLNGLCFHNIRHLRLNTKETPFLLEHLLKDHKLETCVVDIQ